MEERYTRLFTLPKNCYVPGAPVLVEAGALLKDNAENKVIAQLKILNLQNKALKAVTVAFLPFDTTGKVLGKDFDYQYLDLNTKKNQTFGERTPVEFPDATTRAFLPAVMEVIFEDNSQWKVAPDDVWNPLPKQEPLDSALSNPILKLQYQKETTSEAAFRPEDLGEIWRCTCGAVNPSSNGNCRVCRVSKSEFFSNLSSEKLNEKIAQQESRKEEQKKHIIQQKKKRNRIFAFCGITAGFIAVAVVVAVTIVNPMIRYHQAVSFMENEQYAEAIAAFEKMENYRDAPEKLNECISLQEETERKANYDQALELMETGDYSNAILKFSALGDYADSNKKINECYLGLGDIDFTNASYEDALENYKDVCTGDFLETAKEHIYNKGVELYDMGQYKMAHEYFAVVSNHSTHGRYKETQQYISISELLQNDDLSYIVTELSASTFDNFQPAQDILQSDVCSQILQLKDYVGVYRSQSYTKNGESYSDYIYITDDLRSITNSFLETTVIENSDDIFTTSRLDTVLSVSDGVYTVSTNKTLGGGLTFTDPTTYYCTWTFTFENHVLTVLSAESSDDFLHIQTGTYEKIL